MTTGLERNGNRREFSEKEREREKRRKRRE